jgi:hypothetical protein
MLVWASTAVNPPFLFHISVITPLLVLGLMMRICLQPVVAGANHQVEEPHPNPPTG